MDKEPIQKTAFSKLESFIQKYDPSVETSSLAEFERLVDCLDDINTQGNSKNVCILKVLNSMVY